MERYIETLKHYKLKECMGSSKALFEAYKEGFKRLFHPSVQEAVIDENGDYLDHGVICPVPPR